MLHGHPESLNAFEVEIDLRFAQPNLSENSSDLLGQRIDELRIGEQRVGKSLGECLGRVAVVHQFIDERLRCFDDFVVGLNVARNTFNGAHRLDEKHHVRRAANLVIAQDLIELIKHGCNINFCDRLADKLIHHLLHIVKEGALVNGIGLHIAHAHGGAHDHACVASGHAKDQFCNSLPCIGADAANHAAVNEGHAAIVMDEDIARVRISMEEAQFERLSEDGPRAVGNDLLTNVKGNRCVGSAREQLALNLLDGQNTSGGCFPIHLREANARVARKRISHAVRAAGFNSQVGLAPQFLAEFSHNFHGAETTLGQSLLGESGDKGKRLHVSLNLIRCIGAQQLDDHLRTILPDGAVHLRHAGSSKRLGIDPLEQVVGSSLQLFIKCGTHAVEGDLRAVSLQPRKFVSQRIRNQIAARGKNLPDLDEGWPKFLHRLAQAHLKRRGGQVDRSIPAVQPVCIGLPQRREATLGDERCKPVTSEYPNDFTVPLCILEASSEWDVHDIRHPGILTICPQRLLPQRNWLILRMAAMAAGGAPRLASSSDPGSFRASCSNFPNCASSAKRQRWKNDSSSCLLNRLIGSFRPLCATAQSISLLPPSKRYRANVFLRRLPTGMNGSVAASGRAIIMSSGLLLDISPSQPASARACMSANVGLEDAAAASESVSTCSNSAKLAKTVFSPTFGNRIQIRRSGLPSRVMTSILAMDPTPHSGRLQWRTFSPILKDVVCGIVSAEGNG